MIRVIWPWTVAFSQANLPALDWREYASKALSLLLFSLSTDRTLEVSSISPATLASVSHHFTALVNWEIRELETFPSMFLRAVFCCDMGGMGDLVETVCWVHLQACNRVSSSRNLPRKFLRHSREGWTVLPKGKSLSFPDNCLIFFFFLYLFYFMWFQEYCVELGINLCQFLSWISSSTSVSDVQNGDNITYTTIIYKNGGKSLFLKIMKTSVVI